MHTILASWNFHSYKLNYPISVLRVMLVLLNMFKLSQGGASFVDPFFICVWCLSLSYCLVCFLLSCGHLLGKG